MVTVALLGDPTVYPGPGDSVTITVSSLSTWLSSMGVIVRSASANPAGKGLVVGSCW